jgi:hypothetical protein
MNMSTNNDKPQDDNIQQSEWRTAWEEEHEENARLRARIADLERSAASAREIARVAMTHTGTRAIRAEFFITKFGPQMIVCDPAGDEITTTKRLAKFLDAALWSMVGVEPDPDGEPVPIGSSA